MWLKASGAQGLGGYYLRAAVLAFAIFCSTAGFAVQAIAAVGEAEEVVETVSEREPINFVSRHRVMTSEGSLSYEARVENYELLDEAETANASIVATSYVLLGPLAHARPVTFIFNGGPGAASIWLHMGFAGPRIVQFPDDATNAGAPPFNLMDNRDTLLRSTDLVFIDPVGTGFSRPLGGASAEEFWGLDEDAASIVEFIRVYLTRNRRWNSPRFLMGESYGTIRASVVAQRLHNDLAVPLNGVILISPAMNMATLPFTINGNELPYVTSLPAMTAAAFYHGALPGSPTSLESVLAEARQFAATDYLGALFQGDNLDEVRRRQIAQRMHMLTGLDVDYILNSNLRVTVRRFRQELLRDSARSIGLLDTRFVAALRDRVADEAPFDPSYYQVDGPFIAGFQDYLARELGVEGLDQPYIPLSYDANGAWKRGEAQQAFFAGYHDVTYDLADAAAYNDDLSIFIGNGYHDLTTSFFASEYMMSHSRIPEQQYEIHNYPGGHMMYLYSESRRDMANDIVQFIRAADNLTQ